MARYPLDLPARLKQEAEQWAAKQGVSLNQFILWSVAEKVGTLEQGLDDPAYPRISYRRGAAGRPLPVLRGTGIRVQTVVVAAEHWDMAPAQVEYEYHLTEAQVREALAFYEAHRLEIDADLAAEQAMEKDCVQASWTLSDVVTTLDRLLSETEADEWPGAVRWLKDWRSSVQTNLLPKYLSRLPQGRPRPARAPKPWPWRRLVQLFRLLFRRFQG